ncbi:Uncharacterised protein [Vibrio cholerae]|nr:Uncharacterised protein [Vibrio cholerae]
MWSEHQPRHVRLKTPVHGHFEQTPRFFPRLHQPEFASVQRSLPLHPLQPTQSSVLVLSPQIALLQASLHGAYPPFQTALRSVQKF